ncbi:MAG: hypothetical protein BWY22_00954 [Bacteroidetes bacterium ADurb.Bin217]|nr:MAG: hypothetical protein BWY22_00954 [Bacteroidetes bacterium ADurb.Bin217]
MKERKWFIYGIGLSAVFAALYATTQFSSFEDATWTKLFVLLTTILVGSVGLSFIFNTKQYVLNTARIFSGILFIFSGFVKAVDPLGSKYKFIDYFEAWNMSFLDSWALTFGIILSTIEFVVGLALLFKIYTKYSSLLGLLFMIVFTPITMYLAFQQNITGKELVHDCGCFGDALVLTNWQTFIKNLIILIPITIVFLYRKRVEDVLNPLRSMIVTSAFTIAVVGLSAYALLHLPPIDFRPYKKGTLLVNGACSEIAADENSKTLMYAQFKNMQTGEKKEFEITESYPDYTLWQYDTTVAIRYEKIQLQPKTDSIQKPKQRTFVVDNLLFSKQGEDYTCEIIGDTSYVFLVVQYDVVHTNTKPQKQLNELFTWANEQGYTFYAATSSLNELVEDYKQKHDVQYTYLDADDIPLKTIVRANPGLVLLKNGVVIDNWHGNDIPSIEEFKKVLIK